MPGAGGGAVQLAGGAMIPAVDIPAAHLMPPPGLDGRDWTAPVAGTLSFRPADGKRGDLWVIEGDPVLCSYAKRLFPGAAGMGPGIASFPAQPRLFQDLVWLMQRFPLDIAPADRGRWERMHRDTCAHVRLMAEWERGVPPADPDPALFRGTLMPFQAEGLSWSLHNLRTLIADEMGLGKTPQALALAATAGRWPVLIVVQPHLVRQWRRKVAEFLTVTDMILGRPASDGVTVEECRGQRPTAPPDAHILIIHYGLLAYWAGVLEALAPPVMILDEVQEMRHGGTQKYAAAARIAQRAQRVLGLSGTPIYGKGNEIHAVMEILAQGCLGDHASFTREWCGGGATVIDPDLLGRYLRQNGLMIRRVKADVLDQLPAKRRSVESIDLDAGIFADAIREAQQLARKAAATESARERGMVELDAVRSARAATGLAKVPAAADFIAALCEAGEPPVVFAHHHAVFDTLMTAQTPYKPVKLTGREDAAEKDAARAAFIEGRAGVILVALRAAAGLDGLQERARCVVFVELDWSPAVHAQAEDRLHRMGQRDSVLAYYLVTDRGDTTDPAMLEVLDVKAEQARGLMGDAAETEEERALSGRETAAHMKSILRRLRGER